MAPFLRPGGFPFSDFVLYHQYIKDKENLRNQIVALRDPFHPKRIAFRRVIAVEGQWVQRIDDGGIIQIPKGHVWIECENPLERSLDSLSDDLAGPISVQHIKGRCLRIVWPIWRSSSMKDLDKFKLILGGKTTEHSRVYDGDEIFKRFGIN
jgi:mitochondrial inner membrane protease subunit 2